METAAEGSHMSGSKPLFLQYLKMFTILYFRSWQFAYLGELTILVKLY